MTLLGPDGDVDAALDAFWEASQKAEATRTGAPARLRVSSPEIAARLVAELGGRIPVQVAPTPEVDEVAASLREHLADRGVGEASYLAAGDVTPALMARLFVAAARLYRAAPWDRTPADEPLSVGIPALGLEGLALSVIGQRADALGFLLFPDLRACLRYGDAGAAMEAGIPPENVPAHFALNFERAAELDPKLTGEVAAHGWEIVNEDAYPALMAVDPDLVSRPPAREEIVLAEALCLALAQLLEESPGFVDDADEEAPAIRALLVESADGPLEVEIAFPHPGRTRRRGLQKGAAQGATRGTKPLPRRPGRRPTKRPAGKGAP
jgi:hypothetical protein